MKYTITTVAALGALLVASPTANANRLASSSTGNTRPIRSTWRSFCSTHRRRRWRQATEVVNRRR